MKYWKYWKKMFEILKILNKMLEILKIATQNLRILMTDFVQDIHNILKLQITTYLCIGLVGKCKVFRILARLKFASSPVYIVQVKATGYLVPGSFNSMMLSCGLLYLLTYVHLYNLVYVWNRNFQNVANI
jgi:hypothetical protein